MSSPSAGRAVYTPSSFNRLVRATLEDVFPLLEIEGEIGSFRPASSGHWYFVLKDAGAEVKISMFRNRAVLCRLKPANGLQVRVRGRLSVYEARGEYQIVAEHLEAAGLGAKLLALQRLREQLAAEGVFDPARKRALPAWPRRLVVLSSAQGAAVRDVCSVLARRFPLLQVSVWAVPVQGDEAVPRILDALRALATLPPAQQPDVVLLTRGGGSMEDLWCFNDEALVRAVAGLPMPVVAAIGHEIDTTLVELAADLRAATPSAAAELLSPDGVALRQRLVRQRHQLQRQAQRQLEAHLRRLDELQARLERQHPARVLEAARLRLAGVRQRLRVLARHALEAPAQQLVRARWRLLQGATRLAPLRHRIERQQTRLQALSPQQHLLQVGERLQRQRQRLTQVLAHRLHAQGEVLAGLHRTLDAISPQATLDRGYALVIDAHEARLLTQATMTRPGQALRLRFADGTAAAHIDPAVCSDCA